MNTIFDNLIKRLNIKMKNVTAKTEVLEARNQIHGMDIYIQNTEPDDPKDFVWIDTNGIEIIS